MNPAVNVPCPPPCNTLPPCDCETDPELAAALERIKRLTADVGAAANVAQSMETPVSVADTFTPIEPDWFRAADLTDSEVEALILKFLLVRGDAAGATSPIRSSSPSCWSTSCCGR